MNKRVRFFVILQVLILVFTQVVFAVPSGYVSKFRGKAGFATSEPAMETIVGGLTAPNVGEEVVPTESEATLPTISDSRVLVFMNLTEQEAAERLGCLGIISGTEATEDGTIDYDLARPITRLEAYVMLSRVMGLEGIAQELDLPHHFVDVPMWGKPYVGYFIQLGLIQDVEDGYFEPDTTVSANEFMILMYRALGFSANGFDYELDRAAEYGMQAGICESNAEILTRGAAFKIILHTLQTNMFGETFALANYLVEQGAFEQYDIFYYVFCLDKAQVRGYMYANETVAQKETDEGVFAFILNGTPRVLNLAASSGQKNVEGVEITTYFTYTEDLTQHWRLICNADGTYSIYSMASEDGYTYALGFDEMNENGTCVLCDRESENVARFYAEVDDEGNYKFFLADDLRLCLSSRVSSTADFPPVYLRVDGKLEYRQWWKLIPVSDEAAQSLISGLAISFPSASTTTTSATGKTKVSAAFVTPTIRNIAPVQGSAVIRDNGEFEIALSETGYVLNVGVNKPNTDRDGTAVNLYKRTDDISQIFRVALTADGTYRIYSCASNGGYNRVIGFNYRNDLGLFQPSTRYAAAFIFRQMGNGYQIVPVNMPDKVLGVYTLNNQSSVVLCDPADPAAMTVWQFNDRGTANAEGYEYAVFPTDYIYITQTRYQGTSHGVQNATDFVLESSADRAYAPFSGSVVSKGTYSQCNCVYFVSNTPVIWADGTVDYMTAVFMHDNNISDLSVGQHLRQGEEFYDQGTAGKAYGNHIHIALLRGRQDMNSHPWDGNGDINLEDALFLPRNARQIITSGVPFVHLPD